MRRRIWTAHPAEAHSSIYLPQTTGVGDGAGVFVDIAGGVGVDGIGVAVGAGDGGDVVAVDPCALTTAQTAGVTPG